MTTNSLQTTMLHGFHIPYFPNNSYEVSLYGGATYNKITIKTLLVGLSIKGN